MVNVFLHLDDVCDVEWISGLCIINCGLLDSGLLDNRCIITPTPTLWPTKEKNIHATNISDGKNVVNMIFNNNVVNAHNPVSIYTIEGIIRL